MDATNRGSLLHRALMVFGLLLGLRAMASEESSALEEKVKAACLYNFCLNAEWPADAFPPAGTPFIFGFAGDVSFLSTFEEGVRNKTVAGRAIKIQIVRTPQEAAECNLLCIGSTKEAQMAALLLEAVAGKSVLTVGDITGFAQLGGMLNFVKVEGRVRFQVNRSAVERAGLKLGSQLLKLAMVAADVPAAQGG